jgi:predicted chitinase
MQQNAQFNALGMQLNAQFNALGMQQNARFNALEMQQNALFIAQEMREANRFNALNERVESLEAYVQNLDHRVDGLIRLITGPCERALTD